MSSFRVRGAAVDVFPALMVANAAGLTVEYTPAASGATLLLDAGDVCGPLAVARYLARVNAATTLFGRTAVHASQVDSWLDFSVTELLPSHLATAVSTAAPLLRTLANMGVQGSRKQAELTAAVTSDAALTASLTALNDRLAASGFLVGAAMTLADIAVACRLHQVFVLFFPLSLRQAKFPHLSAWLTDLLELPAFESAAATLHLVTGGTPRVGGQVDLRPNPVRVSATADVSIARNKGHKKKLTQREQEKLKKGKALAKGRGDAAPAAPAAGPSSGAGAGGAAPSATAAVELGGARGPERVRSFLAAVGATAAPEESPNLDVERPVGHSTHNLLLKDKKKRVYMVTTRQDHRLDMKALAKQLGTSNLRFANPDVTATTLAVTQGCITPVALLNDESNAVIAAWDAGLPDTLRMCVGCKDPKDHRQHVVADVPKKVLLDTLVAAGHAAPVELTL